MRRKERAIEMARENFCLTHTHEYEIRPSTTIHLAISFSAWSCSRNEWVTQTLSHKEWERGMKKISTYKKHYIRCRRRHRRWRNTLYKRGKKVDNSNGTTTTKKFHIRNSVGTVSAATTTITAATAATTSTCVWWWWWWWFIAPDRLIYPMNCWE